MGSEVKLKERETINQIPQPNYQSWIGGIAFTFAISLLGYGLAQIPGFNQIGQLASAIMIAAMYRQIWGYPEQLRSGIQFSTKRLLRLAIILYGLKLNIGIVFGQGLDLLLRGVITIILSIALTLIIAKWLKADLSLSLLLGIGTGVCGAAAIAAVSPILKSKEEDTAMSAGIIALVGTLFAIAFTILRPFVHLSDTDYGIWSGISLHELAQVALAAAPAGPDALAIGLLAKLSRVFLLVPLSFILMYWMKRTGKIESNSKIEFPWFLIGFLLMSMFGSYILGNQIMLPDSFLTGVSQVTAFILTMAMVGLGLNVNLKDLRTKALKPIIAMSITSVILAVVTLISL